MKEKKKAKVIAKKIAKPKSKKMFPYGVGGTTIGNESELFFNKESKLSTFEITYDSTNDRVWLYFFSDESTFQNRFILTKKQLNELKNFLKDLRLKKNYKLKKKLK